ncbi:MAG TPA: hypothetical protein VKT21_02710, partial [Thermoplasmata archaeon]|nr:hypothetical protein [Thermoplasmata archaeon]
MGTAASAPSGPGAAAAGGAPELLQRRVESVLAVARELQRPLTLDDLLSLLPDGSPATREQMMTWLDAHADLRPLVGGLVEDLADGAPDPLRAERRLRAEGYMNASTALLGSTLRSL